MVSRNLSGPDFDCAILNRKVNDCSGADPMARDLLVRVGTFVIGQPGSKCNYMGRIVGLFILLVAYKGHAQTPNMNDPIAKKDTFIIYPGDYALIAGGSKGIGYAIAEALAKRKFNLILIARGMEGLQTAKKNLESGYGIRVEAHVNDLSREEAADEIAQWCIERDIPISMLCNVAGAGGAKDYLSVSLDTIRYMVRLNVESCMALSQRLLPLLEKNTPAYILNVASMAGLAPIPIKNTYSSTKAAVVSFSYALRYQLGPRNISVSCLAPGPVFTKPEIEKDTKEKLGWFGMQMAVKPERVGEIAVRKTLRRRMLIVPGTLAKITSLIIRALPKKMVVAIYDRAAGKAAKRKERKLASPK